ncbi:MAG TPA: DUF4383 domain-containing protein [Actinomycetota bacterium]|nr:DUF4383 domain-containing protein [Actinomycetota bacterium]
MLSGFTPLSRGRQVATVLGLVYSVLGTVGFAVSGFDGFAAPRGDTLTIFEVNPLQNLIHLALGWWLVKAGFAGDAQGRRAAWSAVAVLTLLGVAGLTLFRSHPNLNVINANLAVSITQLVSAAAAAASLGASVRTGRAGTG